MINMSFNSNFDALSNERLLVQIFQVPKLVGASEAPYPLGTKVTKIGQAEEGL